jgi:hypothetical protein
VGHALNLFFNVISATLSEKFGIEKNDRDSSNPERTTALWMSIKAETFSIGGVNLSSGEKLKDIDGKIQVNPHDEHSGLLGSDGIGTLHYNGPLQPDESHGKIPASYFLEVSLPRKQFEDLLAVARVGRMPTYIEVKVAGLKLPTEFEIRWDTKAAPTLPVTFVSFTVPLASSRDTK